MAIRFLCTSCSRPIEVDDEWALRLVACPFCHETVTAPMASEPGVDTGGPMDRPTAGLPMATPAAQGVMSQRANGAAIAAFVLACGVLACVASSLLLTGAHVDDVRELQTRMQKLMLEGKGMVESARIASDGQFGDDVPAGLAVASAFQCTSAPLWMAALVCGIIGVRRPYRRGYAVFALIALGVAPPLMCLGTVAISFFAS